MFFVINKSKILSYIIAVCTVVILFMLASTGNNYETIQTSTNTVENVNITENNISSNTETNI